MDCDAILDRAQQLRKLIGGNVPATPMETVLRRAFVETASRANALAQQVHEQLAALVENEASLDRALDELAAICDALEPAPAAAAA